MKPRFSSDYRTLVWAFVLFPALIFSPYIDSRLLGWTLPLTLYVGFCAGAFAHNHSHCPTFRSRAANGAFATWVSIFYGHPAFAWIPTHNLNHHKFLNKPGDATISWRHSKRNTWLAASTYPFVSAYWQGALVEDFVKRARMTSPQLYERIALQTSCFRAAHGALFGIAVLLHGWRLGAMVYVGTLGAAAAGGLWGMMFVNFIQHVHCDPWSKHDHSRNFVSRFGNFLVFNNGFHTVHHEHPGAHWSRLPELHATISHEIHPDLCQSSVLAFCLRSYALGAVWPRFRTQQIGRPAHAAAP